MKYLVIEAEFLYGSWKIDKLLGFTDIQTPRCNYPYGQDIIGDVLVIDENFFSSMDLDYDFGVYQMQIENPCYVMSDDNQETTEDLFYNYFKTNPQKIGIDSQVDVIKFINIEERNSQNIMPGGLIIVNDEKIIFYIDSSFFELKKMD